MSNCNIELRLDEINKRLFKLSNLYYEDTMLSYCLKCKKNTESINPKVSKTTNGKAMTCHVLYMVVKNQNLFKSKKQKDY